MQLDALHWHSKMTVKDELGVNLCHHSGQCIASSSSLWCQKGMQKLSSSLCKCCGHKTPLMPLPPQGVVALGNHAPHPSTGVDELFWCRTQPLVRCATHWPRALRLASTCLKQLRPVSAWWEHGGLLQASMQESGTVTKLVACTTTSLLYLMWIWHGLHCCPCC